MLELAGSVDGKKVADLGAGDGRIAITFAKKGAHVDAYEIDDKLYNKLKENVKNEKLEGSIFCHKTDFWETDLSEFDIICIYPMPDVMAALEEKLKREIKEGTKVITNYYVIPKWTCKESKDNVYLYIK